ncbi:MAG: hypothetical protein AMXMBFR84_34180 [Candidatus Hydrogenedentota bacterium]
MWLPGRFWEETVLVRGHGGESVAQQGGWCVGFVAPIDDFVGWVETSGGIRIVRVDCIRFWE